MAYGTKCSGSDWNEECIETTGNFKALRVVLDVDERYGGSSIYVKLG
jgi:Mor family transcriptional regulator